MKIAGGKWTPKTKVLTEGRLLTMVTLIGDKPAHAVTTADMQALQVALPKVPADVRGERPALTTIYYLLPAGAFSRWHRVTSDEIWHLYDGGSLELLELDPACAVLERHVLTTAALSPVCAIAAHHWQAAARPGDYALVGCSVDPGFVFGDFKMLMNDAATAANVGAKWPEVAALI